MRIVFISNYFNHHQKAISEELNKLTKGGYAFIETKPMTSEREKLGWGQENKPSYVVSCYGSEIPAELEQADVVIAGSAPEPMVQYAVKQGKLIFRYSERPLKNGKEPFKYFPRLLKWRGRNPGKKPIYLLCASAYTAGDYTKFGMFQKKCFRWGYFPETRKYADINEILDRKETTKILWVGRFLDWKHPDEVILTAKKLKADGYNFSIDFIGTGILEETLKAEVLKANLSDRISFLGSMPPEKVRSRMEQAGIFLFTSDKREGWGAVLNESMNSACAVVTSHEAGAVPFLIENEKNGLVYESCNAEMLYEKVKYLLDNPQKQKELGRAAYETIVNEWNGETAAERLVRLAEQLLAGEKEVHLFESGPCSVAPVIEESWFQS